MRGKGDGDGAGAGTDIQNSQCESGDARCEMRDVEWVRFFCYPVEDGFDEEFGFGAGDEGVGRDAEGEAEEFLLAGEVLQWFVSGAAGSEGAELREVLGGERIIDVREDEGAVSAEDVREQGFGVTRGNAGSGFGDGGAEGHRGRQ